MTVSLGVRKIEALLQTDRDLDQRVEVMERALRKKGKRKYFITIANCEQVKRIAPHVHAVVVGTALIRCIEEAVNSPLYPRLKAKLEELAGK